MSCAAHFTKPYHDVHNILHTFTSHVCFIEWAKSRDVTLSAVTKFECTFRLTLDL